MKNKIVVKDNALIEASFNLTLIEQRLMLLAIVEAREMQDLTSLVPIEINVKSYIEQYGVKANTAYESLWDASKTLKKREFTYLDRYKGNNAVSVAGWVNKITYVKEKGLIVLYLSEEVISMISRLREQFTKYHLEQVSGFKSKYSLRVYELVIKWLSVGKTGKYEVSDLRAKLGLLPTEYKTMSLFKVNVLDRAVEEISKKTDIALHYEQFRTGRTVSHFLFKITEKPTTKNPLPQKSKLLNFKLTASQINYFANLLANDKVFGGKFGEPGESIAEFENRLKSQLSDPQFKVIYAADLLRLGYVEKQS